MAGNLSQGMDYSAKSMLKSMLVNTLRWRQNDRHFADNIFKCIFFNENVWISLKISLKFAPKVRINNIPGLVQILMAWHPWGTKPLSESMMVRLLTHWCIALPQWVNKSFQSGSWLASSNHGCKTLSHINLFFVAIYNYGNRSLNSFFLWQV